MLKLPHAIRPNRLATQLLTLLILALAVAFCIAMIITLVAQRLNDRGLRDEYAIERVYELTTAIEALSLDNRQQFAKLAKTRTARITVESDAAVSSTATDSRSNTLANAMMRALDRTDIRVTVLSRNNFEVDGDPRDAGRNREVIAVSIPLTPSGWLNFSAREPLSWGTRADRLFLVFVFAVSLLLVSAFAWFFVRKLTRPVEAIATAARLAANGDRTARIESTGPVEIQAAATAFNSMQDQLAQAEAEQVRTVAALGHDLRTPITSLRIRAEMIDNDGLRQQMSNTLDQMGAMADGLVKYAHHKRVEALTEQVDLYTLVKSIADEYGTPFDSQVHPRVTGGPVSLGRAIRNLADNAQRYATLQRITLDIEDAQAVVRIWDRGPGIEPALLGSIMEPFVRGDASRNTDTGGYGLGLAITHEIVQSHGGTLVLQNQHNGKDSGLCAGIALPLATHAKN